jgi:hypothetical protein
MDVKGEVLLSSERKIMVSSMRVTAWGVGRFEELPMP